MNRMPPGSRRYAITLGLVLPAVGLGGLVYASVERIPAAVTAAVLAAVLIEAAFYLAPGFAELREALQARLSPRRLALLMTTTTALPYLVYALPTGQFRFVALAQLLGLAVVVSFWYACLPRRPVVDLVFVAVVAAVVLSRVFARIYLSPAPPLRVDFLGQLMWIRTGALSALAIRHSGETGFGFWPTRREWWIGARYFLYLIPVGTALGLGLGFVSFQPVQAAWWQTLLLAAGTFAGMLWVVALAEEFFFRGLLQRWLGKWLRSRWAGLALASVAFGLAHLPFRAFPNWRFAIIAAAAGVFYGLAFQNSGGIRAAMVAHALVNTAWRLLFR
jgi:membrane protease YdiL (CAAX protease family)